MAGDEIFDLDRVTDGKDIGVAGPHLFVDANSSTLADLDPGHLRQRRLRAHADGEDHDVRRMGLAGTRNDFQRAIGHLLEFGHSVIEFQPDAVLGHVALDENRHLRIERRHDLIEPLDQRHFQPAMNQVFDHLEANEPAADHHRPLRLRHGLVAGVLVHAGWHCRVSIEPLAHLPGVRHGSHRENARQVNAGKRWTDRSRTGREHQFVVMFGGDLTGHMVLQLDRFLFRRDTDHFAARSAIDRELLAKCLFGRHKQARLFFNRAAHVIRQPAVRVRNIRSTLDHQDVGFFIQPAQPRRTRCSASHSTNDDDFHFSTSISFANDVHQQFQVFAASRSPSSGYCMHQP